MPKPVGNQGCDFGVGGEKSHKNDKYWKEKRKKCYVTKYNAVRVTPVKAVW